MSFPDSCWEVQHQHEIHVRTVRPNAACGAPARTSAPQNPSNDAVGVKIGQSGLGPILTDLNGRTLYAFVNDKSGNSTCTDGTLLSATKRTDGVDQAKTP